MAIPFVREFDFEYGRCDAVSPLIRRVVAENPGPFTFTGTGTYIIGHGEVAVIDPGPDLPDHLAAILAATAGETIRAILVTHNHADHSPLAIPLAKISGARTYGMPLYNPAGHSLTNLEEAHDDAFRPDEIVGAGSQIGGPGWTLEALPTPGHTANHVCYALIEENALFTGDHVMGWATTVIIPPDGDMGAYNDSLRAVAAREFSILWPTHGPPVTDPAPHLAAYLAHRIERESQIARELAKGPRTVGQIVDTLYTHIGPRLRPAAAVTVWAHLIELARDGRARADGGEPRLDATYRAKP